MTHIIRQAVPNDSSDILKIYAHYVENTAVSFEVETPSEAEFSERISEISKIYPYLVDTLDGEIVGFAYASKHKERAAYRYDVDTSIYVNPAYHGGGIARRLYGCLFEILKLQGFFTAYAGVATPNEKSMRFHTRFGFSPIGTFHKSGFKLGAWQDMTLMEKAIQANYNEPGQLLTVNDISNDTILALCDEYSL